MGAPLSPRLPPDAHQIYLRDDPPEGSQRGLKHHLVREGKRLIEAIGLLDLNRIAPATLEELVDQTAAIAGRLDQLPSLRDRGGPALAGGDDAALMERSGISGRSNPLAPPLHLTFERDRTRGWAVWTDGYEGPPGCLHGGFVAAAFDDLMGLAQIASGKAGYTGTLTVRMRRPTPLNTRIDYDSWVERVEGRKIIVRATAMVGELLLAEAEILFIEPKSGPIGPSGANAA